MDTMDWNTVKTLDIVVQYRKYPALWRSADTLRKSRNALQELGEKYLMQR
jgi:hypothetical protein